MIFCCRMQKWLPHPSSDILLTGLYHSSRWMHISYKENRYPERPAMLHLKILQNSSYHNFLQRKMEYHKLEMEQEYVSMSSTPNCLTTSLKMLQLNAAQAMEQIGCRITKLFKAVSIQFLLQSFCAIYVACYESFAKVYACYLTKYLQEEVNNEQKLLLSITGLNPKTTHFKRGNTSSCCSTATR